MTIPSILPSATHVTFDRRAAERLVQLGATSIVRAHEHLIIGPSRVGATEHVRAREVWSSSCEQCSDTDDAGEKWDQLYSSDVRWDPPVVLWTTESLADRVNLWRICGYLRSLGIQCNDVLIVEFERVYGTLKRFPEPPRIPPFDCSGSVAHHSDEILLDRLDKAHPWSVERYERAIRLWESYADENPLHFVEACITGVEGFPELASLWALLSRFFPRRTAEGALHLSRYDNLILSILSVDEWQTPVRVICNKSELGLDLLDFVSCTGDLFLGDRLAQWAKHDLSAVVERAPGPRPPNAGYPMLSEVYRLTERGMRLRDKGLDQLTDAPSLPIAGTEAYSASAPWVLLEDGRLARL
ncbi:hypothetical protein BE17_29755 [Sorangium cellulosum]|uniref:DUF1835 domain-containing protein n=1 Tax=Sorangium cellulosum TaxID=56 RepID=A0A150QZQ0_SORCE|nr:hypothetical protein BE17_29755 [Sorangium cellulosum]